MDNDRKNELAKQTLERASLFVKVCIGMVSGATSAECREVAGELLGKHDCIDLRNLIVACAMPFSKDPQHDSEEVTLALYRLMKSIDDGLAQL